MAAEQFENPNLIVMNEELQVMSRPSATTGVSARNEPQPPMVNGVRNPLRTMNLDGELVSPADEGRGPVSFGPSVATTQPREEAERFLASVAPGSSAGYPVQGQTSGQTVESARREDAAPDVGGFCGSGAGARGSMMNTPPPPPRSGGTSGDLEGYQSAQSFSPGDVRQPPSETQIPQTPLFDSSTWRRLRELPSEAPHLYLHPGVPLSAGGPPSTHSSDIQMEVRRQLSEMMLRHDVESERLRRQVELLATENRELRDRVNSSGAKGASSGSENTGGIPGLGWLGRGIRSILGAKGSPSRGVDFDPRNAPVPPPPPPSHPVMDFNPNLPPFDSQGVPSSGLEYQSSTVPPGLESPGTTPVPPGTQSTTGGAPGNVLDPLSIVLTGMAQLQGVVSELATSPKTTGKAEVIKPGVSSLPDLPEASSEACLEFSDWLHNTRPALADVSDTSGELWELVVQEAGVWYSQYLRMTPIERLTFRAIPSDAIQDPRWTRVSRRIETMIIAAAPTHVKEELSAARVSGLFQVTCRLYIIYAPGGLSEREIGLRQIQDPQTSSSIKEVIALLRKWQRWCARMKDLGSTLPDSSLRVKALEKMTKAVLAANTDISFRISLARAELKIDLVPDDAKVDHLHAQMLSELEAAYHRSAKESERDRARDSPATSQPKVRGIEASEGPSIPKAPKAPPKGPPKPPVGKQLGSVDSSQPSRPKCTFFHGPQGCKKGNDCTFEHDWNSIPYAERSSRCKTCGGKGHRSAECKSGLRIEEKAKPKGGPKNTNNPRHPQDSPLTPPPPAPTSKDAVLKTMLADAAAILQQSVPTQGGSIQQPVGPPPVPISSAPAKATNAGGASPSPQANFVTPGTPVTIESLAAQLEGLRSMAQGYEARACMVDNVLREGCEISRVLLDTGATHAVVPSEEGLKQKGLEKVSVTLAGDSKQSWYRTKGGTLVVPPQESSVPGPSQPQMILPLGALVESLGCSISWSKRKGLRVTHPRHGVLNTGVASNTCPYLQERQALSLIEELEEAKLKELGVRVQTLELQLKELSEPVNPTTALRSYIETGSRVDALRAVFAQPFLKGIPEDVKVRLAEEIDLQSRDEGKQVLKRLPLSRAMRRSLLSSRKWIVQLCDGRDFQDDPIKKWGKSIGCEVLQVDVLKKGGKGWDLTKVEGVWSVLLWAAATGRIACITSSAPRRTWNGEGDHPAEEILGDNDSCWIRPGTRNRVWSENLLVVQDMFLWSLASVAKGRGIPFLKEFTCNGVGDAGMCNFWSSPTWKSFEQWSGAKKGMVPFDIEGEERETFIQVGTNLEWDDMLELDDGCPSPRTTRWSLSFRNRVCRALAGMQKVPTVEALDKRISEVLERKRRANSGACEDVDQTQPISKEGPFPPGPEATEVSAAAINAKDKDFSSEELEGWKAHIARGHLPYRRDCLHCVRGSGLGIQHKTVKYPASFALSVDLFGPMSSEEKGQDEEAVSGIPQVRYGLVGAFRIPREVLLKSIDEKEDRPNEEGSKERPELDPDPEGLAEYEPSAYDPDERPDVALFDDEFDLFEGSIEGARALALEAEDADSGLSKELWESEELPSNEEELREYLKGMVVPADQVVLRYFIALKSKTGAEVMSGLQRMILGIMKDYPVRVLHCDPGTEFTSDALKRWLFGQAIRLQNPLPTDKQANGLAERTIGWCKARARTLIGAASLPVQFWPLAMRYACEVYNRAERREPALPGFGQEVLHKLKRPPATSKELMRRWIVTRYLAPHLTVPEGHVLLTEHNTLVASKGFKKGSVDPEALSEAKPPMLQELEEPEGSGEPNFEDEPVLPLRRLREKTSVRAVRLRDNHFEDPEAHARMLLQEEDFTGQALRGLADTLCKCEEGIGKDRRGSSEGRFVFGAYCHGGLRGITSLTTRRPWTTRYLNAYMKQANVETPDVVWSSIMLMTATEVEPHKDFRNEWGSRNLVVCVPGNFELSVHGFEEESVKTSVLGARAVSFDPRNVHGVTQGATWFLAAYTPLGSKKIHPERKEFLEAHGFGFGLEEMPRIFAVSEDHEEPGQGSNDMCVEVAEPSQVGTLADDEQLDSVTAFIGWDPNRGAPGDAQPLVLEEVDLEEFLRERGVDCELERLGIIGVQEAVDLQFLYVEDLIEEGIPEISARRIMFGIHPEGTVRPDEPSNCALRTGEVRLYDRSQRQIPWVIQNRTLDYGCPPPPVQGIGVTQDFEYVPPLEPLIQWGEGGPVDPDDPTSERREVTTEICYDLPEESTEPRVNLGLPGSSNDPPCGSDEVPESVSLARFRFNNSPEEVVRLQSIWDSYESICEAADQGFQAQEEQGVLHVGEVDNVEEEITAEISDLPEESTEPRVIGDYSCRMLTVGAGISDDRSGVQDCTSPKTTGTDDSVETVSTIGVPVGNPLRVLFQEEKSTKEGTTEADCAPGIRKVDDSFYTPNVESLLSELQSNLRVVHNVSPSEVRQYVDRWKQAALTEVTALEGMKAIVRLRGDEALRESRAPSVQILPAKTVFTVKPGSGDNYYRRKCRVVGCGNFEDKNSGLDLYAGGIPADALRAMLIEASKRGYLAFITDATHSCWRQYQKVPSLTFYFVHLVFWNR